jgi:transposase
LPGNRRHRSINRTNHEYECDGKKLALIAQKEPKGRHAVIVVDGVAWHQVHLTEKFDNLSIIKLLPPLYSPGLNPIEQVWQWLRQNELANRYFSGYEDIVNKGSRAWNIFFQLHLG